MLRLLIMAELVLHSFRRCPFAIRVRMALEEKGLLYSVLEEDLAHPSLALQDRHPQARVPVLVLGSEAIFESSVINEYLDEVYPDSPLMSKDSFQRAQMRMWTVWCDSSFKPDIDLFKYEWRELSEDSRLSVRERLRGHLKKLAEALTQNRFLMGETLSLADIHVFPFYRQLRKSRPNLLEIGDTARLDPWLERILERPSFLRAMRKF